MYLFCFKQKTAYDMRMRYWSSDVCSSDLGPQISLFRHIGQCETEIACAHIFVGKFGLPGINAQLLRDGFAQFHAGCIDTGSRVIGTPLRSEEHTSELQSLMGISYAVFCLKKKTKKTAQQNIQTQRNSKTKITSKT